MHIVMDAGQLAKFYFGVDQSGQGQEKKPEDRDVVELSQEALKRYKESVAERMKNGTYTLDVLGKRVNEVYREIDDVWDSPLPYKEKVIQTRAKETEISLLQAGQFEFAKAMSTWRV